MNGFVNAAVVGVRQLLALTIAVSAIAGAAYLVGHKLSNPYHYPYGGCFDYGTINNGPVPRCSLPTRAAWQIPLAVVIGVVGLGSTVVVIGRRPWRRVEALYDSGDAFRIASR